MLSDRPRPEATEDGAIFAPVRVKGARRPRLLASVVVLTVAGLIAAGALDREAPPESSAVAVSTAGPTATLPAETARSSRPAPAASIRLPGPFGGRPGPSQVIDLDVRPAGSDLFIHGDVFSLAVTRVTVRLEDSAGNVAATTSVDIPSGSTAFRIGAVPRFDVHFLLAAEVQAAGFMVSATARDSAGRTLTTLLQVVDRPTKST